MRLSWTFVREAPHNWLIRKLMVEVVERNASFLHGELLDIGCADKPYEAMIAPHVSRYVGLEHPETRHDRSKVDVWGDATALPFEDGSFDSVLCMEVLEHVERPAVAVAEMARILRPRGRLLLTTPFMWGLHEEPRDFYRYTPHGLRHLLREAGFREIEISATSGYWVTAALGFSYWLERLGRAPALLRGAQVAVQLVGALLERVQRDEIDATVYVTRAVKPSG